MKKGIILILIFTSLLFSCKKPREQFYYHTKEEVVIDYLNHCREERESDYCVRFDTSLDRFENEVEIITQSTYYSVVFLKYKDSDRKEEYQLGFFNNMIECETKKGTTIYYNFRRG